MRWSDAGKAFNYIISGVVLIAFASAFYVWVFGLWPRYFDIAWNEEVQLHDGRIVVVSIKRTYERMGKRIERWKGLQRATEISFDTGLPIGRFTHEFKAGDLNFLDQKDGKWYLGYYADFGDASSELGTRSLYPHVAILELDGQVKKPKSWEEVPTQINQVNIMPPTPNSQGISKFHNTLLTLSSKMRHWSQYPIGADERKIVRLSTKPAQGEKK